MSESTSGDLTDPAYLQARAFSLRPRARTASTRRCARDNLDAIIAPSYSFASTPAAVAGYPKSRYPAA